MADRQPQSSQMPAKGAYPCAPAIHHGATLQQLTRQENLALATCEAAARRLGPSTLRRGVAGMASCMRRHVDELQAFVGEAEQGATETSAEQRWLLAGKMTLAQVVGDAAVLRAVQKVVQEVNLAYERALSDDALSPAALAVLQRNFVEERRHRRWLASRLAHVKHAPPAA